MRASERRYRELAEALEVERADLEAAQRVVHVGSWRTDYHTLEVDWSEETYRLLGLDPDTFVPTHLTLFEFVHPADRAMVDEAFRSSFATREVHSIIHRIILGDGTLKHVEERWRTFVDEAGAPLRAMGTCQDITERQEAVLEVERSQAMLRVASSMSKVGALRVDLATGTRYWSDQLSAIFDLPPGYTPGLEEALSFYDGSYRVRMQSIYERCITQGIPYDEELEVTTATGRRVWLRVIGEAVRSRDGTIIALQGAVQDITEKRLVAEALRASEERFRVLATATNDASYDRDLVTDAMVWNDGFEHLFGYARHEIEQTSASWIRLVHDDDRERILGELRVALDSREEFWAGEYRFRRQDGRYAYVLDRGYIFRQADDTPMRMIGGITDLTDRKEAELRLAQQAMLLDAAHDAILVKDLDDRITYWNKGAERTFGWKAEEVMGRIAAELFHVDPVRYREAHAALLANGQWEGELVKRGRDGKDRTVEGRWTLVTGGPDRPSAIFAIDADVTERKRLEAQFLRTQRLESLGTLAGGIAHDLNNVLAPILISIELLRDEEDDPHRLESLATIEASAQRGAEMVKQVLSFARGAEGKRLTVDLRRIVRDVGKIVQETFPKDIALRLELAPALWTVIGDETQIHQVVMNLCVNARDAMPQGGVLTVSVDNAVLDEIYAGMNPDSRPGPYVRISVADTGDGIPPEVQERLFEPFFTTKEHGKGTGLGLSTVHSIVRAHHGVIDVHSEPRKGSRFTIHLPATEESAPGNPAADSETGLPRGHGEEVLVVDDEASIRQIVQRTLERFGYRVRLASDGAEAVALYAQHRDEIAVVLTDMAMPVMDGPAMILALKALDPAVRIIGSSGLATHDEVIRAVGAGVEHFVPKPYTAETLLTTLRRILSE